MSVQHSENSCLDPEVFRHTLSEFNFDIDHVAGQFFFIKRGTRKCSSRTHGGVTSPLQAVMAASCFGIEIEYLFAAAAKAALRVSSQTNGN